MVYASKTAVRARHRHGCSSDGSVSPVEAGCRWGAVVRLKGQRCRVVRPYALEQLAGLALRTPSEARPIFLCMLPVTSGYPTA